MRNWIIVSIVAVAILVIGSRGLVPFTDKQSSLSDERRTATAKEYIPTYTRQQAINFVEEHIRETCAAADVYLPNRPRFEATWMREPRTDDHHERGMREWTVTDPMTGAYWRLYEDDLSIVDVIGDC